jgi:hypothetical protein
MASSKQERRNELARQRGFRNAYHERISKAMARGETLSQARGHAKPSELTTTERRKILSNSRDWYGRYVMYTHDPNIIRKWRTLIKEHKFHTPDKAHKLTPQALDLLHEINSELGDEQYEFGFGETP